MTKSEVDTCRLRISSGRHAAANRMGPGVLLEIARDCQQLCPESCLPAIEDEAYDILREKLNKAEKVEFIDNLPVPLASFPPGQGLFPEARILLIDDEHKRGWSTVLGTLLFGQHDLIFDLAQNPQAPAENRNGLFAIDEVGDVLETEDLSYLWEVLDIDPEDGQIRSLPFDAVFCDYRAKGEDPGLSPNLVSGTRIIRKIQEIDPSIPIIVITASENFKTFRQLFLYGILSYYVKPYNLGMDETKQEYLNFCDLVNFVRDNRYWRDLWKIVVWLSGPDRPQIRKCFLNDRMKKLLGSGSPDASVVEVDKLVMDRLQEWIGDAARFIYKRSRGLMFSKTIFDDDREISIFHTVEIFTWVLFRMSIISDSFYLSARSDKGYKALGRNSRFFYLAAETCRYIRNLTMHPGSFSPAEEDMFIMVFCLAEIAFTDPIPKHLTRRLENHTTKFAQVDLNTIQDAYISAYRQINPETLADEVEGSKTQKIEKFLQARSREKTEVFMLHGTYIAMLDHLTTSNYDNSTRTILLGLLGEVLNRTFSE